MRSIVIVVGAILYLLSCCQYILGGSRAGNPVTDTAADTEVITVLDTNTNENESSEDDSIWRLAGSFNNWNTTDNGWLMSRLPDGRFYIHKYVSAGRYDFKFVSNGSWSNYHLGRVGNQGDRGGSLTQPGNNIELVKDGDGIVDIILDPVKKDWSLGIVPEVEEPVSIIALRGVPRVNVAVVIDLRDSLVPTGQEIVKVEIEPADGNTDTVIKPGVSDSDSESLLSSWEIVPNQSGHYSYKVRIQSNKGIWSEWAYFALDVMDRVLFLDFTKDTKPVDLVPIDTRSGVWAAVYTAISNNTQVIKIHDTGKVGTITAIAEGPANCLVGEMDQNRHHEEGGTFALVYHRRLGKAQVIPGDYSLEQDEHGVYKLVENTPMPVNGIFHDPRRPEHFNAISTGLQLVDICVETESDSAVDDVVGETLSVIVHGDKDGDEDNAVIFMIADDNKPDSNGRRKWKARISFSDHFLLSGSNNKKKFTNKIRYSIKRIVSGSEDSVKVLGPFEKKIDPLFETPDWAKTAVWYQIFPERFRNGDAANDPHGPWVFPLAWNAKWRTVLPGEFEAWQARVRLSGGDPAQWDRGKGGRDPADRFFNVVWDRRYGGDLQGIIEKLDFIRGLGVNAIYLNPVFAADSQHKYDTRDYRHIDDNFGSPVVVDPDTVNQFDKGEVLEDPDTWVWTDGDKTFLKLIAEAHRRGLKIIIDGVFNHVGRSHPAFQDLMHNGKKSVYADWFMARFDNEGKLAGWEAWDGKDGWLPRFAQDKDGSLVYPVKKHIFDITRRWMDPDNDGNPADGIDGWRLDVPLEIGDAFWYEWCGLVRQINGKAYITGEIWSDWESVPRLRGYQFDAQMHYPFGAKVIDWLAMRPGMSSDDLAYELAGIFSNDAPQTQMVQQNLFESHDTDRLVSNLYNVRAGREFDKGNRPQQGEVYREGKPDARAYALSKLALVFQATYIGAPMIYYGQEIGMHGADDPSNRKPRPWPDLGAPEDPEDMPDLDLEEFYRNWLQLRNHSPILQFGMVVHHESYDPDVFAFERRLNSRSLLVVINKSSEPYALSKLKLKNKVFENRSVGAMDATVVELNY